MKRKDIANFIKDHQNDDDKDSVLIDGYESAFMGYVRTEDGLSAVYSYIKIIDKLMDDNMTYQDAVEYFDYNIERGIDYITEGIKPTILHLYT